MKSFHEFKTVSVTKSGDYYQILFHDDLDKFGSQGTNFQELAATLKEMIPETTIDVHVSS